MDQVGSSSTEVFEGINSSEQSLSTRIEVPLRFLVFARLVEADVLFNYDALPDHRGQPESILDRDGTQCG